MACEPSGMPKPREERLLCHADHAQVLCSDWCSVEECKSDAQHAHRCSGACSASPLLPGSDRLPAGEAPPLGNPAHACLPDHAHGQQKRCIL